MANRAIRWALKQRLPRSSQAHVLLVMADAADKKTFVVFKSIETLAAQTSQNRKTVIAAIGELEKLGLITDTGTRKCRVPVYRVNCPENGTGQQSQKRDTSDSEEGSSSTVFSSEQSRFFHEESQKRDTERSISLLNQREREQSSPSLDRFFDLAPEAFAAWIAHLRKLGNPFDAYAQDATIAKLREWQRLGHDPKAVLDLALASNWKTLWAKPETVEGYTPPNGLSARANGLLGFLGVGPPRLSLADQTRELHDRREQAIDPHQKRRDQIRHDHHLGAIDDAERDRQLAALHHQDTR